MIQGWHRADIRAAVEKRGKTLSQLALDNGLKDWACRHALTRRHPPGEQAIAAHIGVPLWELWPDRWHAPAFVGAEPTRITHWIRRKSLTTGPARHCQKTRAA